MKIGFSIEKLKDSFMSDKKNFFRAGAVVIILIIALIIIGTQTKKIQSLNTEKEAELKKNQALAEISNLEKKVKSYKNTLGKKDTGPIIEVLKNLAKDSNVTIVSVKPVTDENFPLYTKSHFAIVAATDSYHDIGKFISRVENHPNVFFVDAMSIKTQEESQASGKQTVQMPKQAGRLIIDLALSIIAFKG